MIVRRGRMPSLKYSKILQGDYDNFDEDSLSDDNENKSS